ncbi:MAG: UDP-2,3-diacylglucosamine diphosphatase [OM182 bacterium]|jgi:UDP-2,3-diacylglucosamine hydrolase|nr:UDP-2,3-diacylglucosamine diphosphatase [OM182 bacterium]
MTQPDLSNLPTLLISDLHLQDSRPDLTRALMGFLDEYRGRCSQLFILGDLFEAWIGDDDPSALADEVAVALADFASTGAKIALMHGNRDFLLGEAYAARCGARLMGEVEVITSGSRPILLMHGDSLCTDDIGYQEFRSLVRQPTWQAEFLGQPLEARHAFAAQARAQSREATSSKANEIMDVNQLAVQQALVNQGVCDLVHGHTHRPSVHEFAFEGLPDRGEQQATRTVLGDWETSAWFAQIHAGKISLLKYNFQ